MISRRKGSRGVIRRFMPWVFAALMLSPLAMAANQLHHVEVTAGENGKALLSLTLEDKSVVTNFNKKDGVLEIVLKGTEVEDNLIGSRSLLELKKAVQRLDVSSRDDDVLLKLVTKDPFGYDYYQNNNVLTVEVFPLPHYRQGKVLRLSKVVRVRIFPSTSRISRFALCCRWWQSTMALTWSSPTRCRAA